MKTIAIVARKGGTGKTTLAVHLGVAFLMQKKQVALIDLDPQSSLSSWGDSRENKLPVVLSVQASRLQHILKTAQENNADITIIDTAANAETSALAAISVADLILVPCRPGIFDLKAIQGTVDLARMAHKSPFIVLNAVPSRGNLADDAHTAILEQGIEVCPWRLTQRIAFVHAVTAGLSVQEYEPNGKAALEVKNLYRWVLKQLR